MTRRDEEADPPSILRLLTAALLLAALLLLWWVNFKGPERKPPVPPPPPASRLKPPAPAPTTAPPDEEPQPPEADPAPAGRSVEDLDRLLGRIGRAFFFNDRAERAALRPFLDAFSPRDLPRLVDRMENARELWVKMGAADVLGEIGTRAAVDALAEAFQQRPWSLVFERTLVLALGRTASGAAGEALLRHYEKASGDGIRADILRALAGIADPSLVPALWRIARSDANGMLRRLAVEAMMTTVGADLAADLLDQTVKERDPAVRKTLILASARAGGKSILGLARQTVADDPEVLRLIQQDLAESEDHRYDASYAADFFRNGGRPAPFDPAAHQRIGFVVSRGPVPPSMETIAASIFGSAPLDRYRDAFYLRDAAEMAEDALEGGDTLRAYDARGREVRGGLPLQQNESTVYIAFDDFDSVTTGCLGFTVGRTSHVTAVSLLHELGHSLAKLADEYSDARASVLGGVNLSPRKLAHPAWQPLTDKGFLSQGNFPRIERVEGLDKGLYAIPSTECYMGNSEAAGRFCPVCQLEIIAKVVRLTGQPRPW